MEMKEFLCVFVAKKNQYGNGNGRTTDTRGAVR